MSNTVTSDRAWGATSESPAQRLSHLIPFGLGQVKPHHFREMLAVVWENRDSLSYAWEILTRGVCDGCSLGPRGLRDDVQDGIHLCMTRLKLLRVNTMGALDPAALIEIERLRGMSNEQLQYLGRLSFPLIRCRGDQGFRRLSWEDALSIVAKKIRDTKPERLGFFATSRGLTNETYYVFQKLARALGSNNVDLCARFCHAASVYGLKETLGIGAPTCSLSDLIGTDLLIVWGSDLPNNQPVSTKYMHLARKRGTKIIVVNPLKEYGLQRYWIPSNFGSALLGTKLMDEFYPVNVGGDIALINGILKALIARGGINREFIAQHTSGFEQLRTSLDRQSWESLEESSGLPRAAMERFAELYTRAQTAVFVYSMGLTQHRFGVQNVKALVNLALARGMLGREKCGILPIRGHSGVQGGGECGVDPEKFAGGFEVNEENARRFAQLWGFPVPASRGLKTPQLLEAAHKGEVDLLYSIGGNLLETMPDRLWMREALSRIPTRIHQDIVLNTSMLLEGDLVIVFPAQTRYEQRGGGTSTNTERRIRFSPEIPGHVIGESKPEWEIPVLLARACGIVNFGCETSQQIREEIAQVMPTYTGIETLAKEGDSLQWGGPQLFVNGFENMPERRARFTPVEPPPAQIPDGHYHLSTRRGKQFNTMTFGSKDRLMGSVSRNEIFISAQDAARENLREGDRVKLLSTTGEFVGVLRFAPIKSRHLQGYWPEINTLIPRRYDEVSGEPDYNAIVRLEKL